MHHIFVIGRSGRRGVALALLLVLAWGAQGVQAIPAQPHESGARLETLAEHIGAGRFEQAAVLVEALPLADYAPAERLRAHQMIGYLHAHRGDYASALFHYARALEQPAALSADLERRIRYTMAQLEFALGRFDAAVEQMQAWQALGPEGEAFGPYILMGQAYFKVEQYASAIDSLEQGLRRAESQGAPLREDWLQLLHFLYVERARWRDAVGVLEHLSAMFPNPRYQRLLEEARARRG